MASVGVDIEREREIEDICALNVQKILSHISSHRNQSSLTNLLVSFFDKVLSSNISFSADLTILLYLDQNDFIWVIMI